MFLSVLFLSIPVKAVDYWDTYLTTTNKAIAGGAITLLLIVFCAFLHINSFVMMLVALLGIGFFSVIGFFPAWVLLIMIVASIMIMIFPLFSGGGE
jgi:hypothetical protein